MIIDYKLDECKPMLKFYVDESNNEKSGEQLRPPFGVMCSPVKNAVTAALLKVLDVWMPSQLMCASGFGHGGETVRLTNLLSTMPVWPHVTSLLKL